VTRLPDLCQPLRLGAKAGGMHPPSAQHHVALNGRFGQGLEIIKVRIGIVLS
jgi:hypothetical protein